MLKVELLGIIEVANTLGEGVIWNIEDQSVWWTDIDGCLLYCYHPNNKALKSWKTPEKLCSFGFVQGEPTLIAAFASGFAMYEPEAGKVDWLCKINNPLASLRLNDGRVDRQGRFWAGSMMLNQQQDPGLAKLYCLDPQGLAQVKETNILISNGLCWSPDSQCMYFADSPRRTIYAYDFCEKTGTASKRTVFAKTPENIFPDGSTVDAQGYLWNAQWGGSQVVRYTPDGKIDFTLKLPLSQPSCVAFGGSDLDLLFVTSAQQDLSPKQLQNDPDAGHVLIYKTNITGLAESKYKRVIQ